MLYDTYFCMSSVPPRQKKSRPQSWDIVHVAPWTDAGAIDESHVIAGKRQRKSITKIS